MEANISVPGPFQDICLALGQLAYVMAERVRLFPQAPCSYLAPLEIRWKDVNLNTQNQKHTVLLGTQKR